MQLHRRRDARAPYHLDVGGVGGKRNMCPVGGWTSSEGEINMARPAGSISRCRVFWWSANERVVPDDSRQVLVE